MIISYNIILYIFLNFVRNLPIIYVSWNQLRLFARNEGFYCIKFLNKNNVRFVKKTLSNFHILSFICSFIKYLIFIILIQKDECALSKWSIFFFPEFRNRLFSNNIIHGSICIFINHWEKYCASKEFLSRFVSFGWIKYFHKI